MSKTNRFEVSTISIESSGMKREALSSFLAKCGFGSKTRPIQQLSEGAEPNPGEKIFLECDEDFAVWYKLMRTTAKGDVQIEAGAHYTITTESPGTITFSLRGYKITGQWIVICKKTGSNMITSKVNAKLPSTTIVKEVVPEKPKSVRTVQRVKISLIRPFDGQPRKYFCNLSELKGSIVEVGMLQLPIVRRLPENEKNKDEIFQFELIDGERRLRSVQEAGETEMDVVVIEAVLTRAQRFAMAFAANQNKEDHTLGETADGLVQMAQDGYTQTQIQQILGKSPTWFNQHYMLRNLHPDLKKLLDPPVPEDDRLRFGDARMLCKIADKEGQLRLYNGTLEMTKNPKVFSTLIKKAVIQSPDRKQTSKFTVKSIRSLSRFNERIDADLFEIEHMVQDIADYLRATRSPEFMETLLDQLKAHAKRFERLSDSIMENYSNSKVLPMKVTVSRNGRMAEVGI